MVEASRLKRRLARLEHDSVNRVLSGDSHGAVGALDCAGCVDCDMVEAAEFLAPLSGRSGSLDFGAGRRFQSRSRSLGLALSLLRLLSQSLRMSLLRSQLRSRLRLRPLSSLSHPRPRNLSAPRGSCGEYGPLALLASLTRYVSAMMVGFRRPVPYSAEEGSVA